MTALGAAPPVGFGDRPQPILRAIDIVRDYPSGDTIVQCEFACDTV